MTYLFWFILALAVSVIATLTVRRLAVRAGIVDRPDGERKIHRQPIPLLGGLAVYAAFATIVVVAAAITGRIIGVITWPMLMGVIIAGAVLVFGGAWDDKKNLPPKWQIVFPAAAIAVVVGAGIGVAKLSNPFGAVIFLAPPLSGLIIVPYLLGTTYATKLFDGLDGLVAGVTAIGALLITTLSLTPKYYQPDVALIAVIVAGAFIGFLFFNFYPATIFLGEGGALFSGFILGVLSIISGAKIAVVLMALGVAVVDAAWVILRRVFWEKRAPFSGDRKHLHFRLLDAGFSQRSAVILIWFISAAFGASTLLLQSTGKMIAFILLAVVTIAVGVVTIITAKKRYVH